MLVENIFNILNFVLNFKLLEKNIPCRLFNVLSRSLDMCFKRPCSLYFVRSYLFVTMALKMYFQGIFSLSGCHTMLTFLGVLDIPEIPGAVVVFRFLNQCCICILIKYILGLG